MKISSKAADANRQLINSLQKKWANEEEAKRVAKLLGTTAKEFDVPFFLEFYSKTTSKTQEK
jgi:hypothetical protein